MVSTFPFLALLAAQALFEGVSKFKLTDRMVRVVITILAVLIVTFPAHNVIRWDHRMSQKDTRIIAKEWIEENIPAGSKILLDSGKYYVSSMGPPLQDSRENLRRKYLSSLSIDDGAAERKGTRWRTQYHRESEFYAYRLDATSGITYNLVPIMHDLALGKTRMQSLDYYREQGVQYVVTSSYARWAYRSEFFGALDTQATLIKDFVGNPVDRPGPTLKIYKLAR